MNRVFPGASASPNRLILGFIGTAMLMTTLIAGCRNSSADDDVAPREDLAPGWFIVSEIEKRRNDSYLVYIDQPETLRVAIALAYKTSTSKILVASIEKGPDGMNRNVSGDGKLWNWHVKSVLDFADMTAEILDGWPGQVESDVDGWIQTTGGKIGFWGYTITGRYNSPRLYDRPGKNKAPGKNFPAALPKQFF